MPSEINITDGTTIFIGIRGMIITNFERHLWPPARRPSSPLPRNGPSTPPFTPKLPSGESTHDKYTILCAHRHARYALSRLATIPLAFFGCFTLFPAASSMGAESIFIDGNDDERLPRCRLLAPNDITGKIPRFTSFRFCRSFVDGAAIVAI